MIARARLELGLGSPPAPLAARARVLESNGSAELHVGPEGSCALEDAFGAFTTVTVDSNLLVSRLDRTERVELLRTATSRLGAGGRLSLGLRISVEAVRGRILLDAPRARLPFPGVPEAGSRFFPGKAVHLYFTHDELLDEAALAGLGLVAWENATFVFERSSFRGPVVSPRSTLASLVRAVVMADFLRRGSPREALARARSRGEREIARTREERLALRERLALVEGLVPPRANCFRRVLAEILLDRGAASDAVIFSLDPATTGHAHFHSDPNGPPRRYDVAFEA
jgi:hypothetical protein